MKQFKQPLYNHSLDLSVCYLGYYYRLKYFCVFNLMIVLKRTEFGNPSYKRFYSYPMVINYREGYWDKIL